MSPPITPSDLLQALEAALFALEDDLRRAPCLRLRALLVRRRRAGRGPAPQASAD